MSGVKGPSIFEQFLELLDHPHATWEEKERELKRRLIPLIEGKAGVIEPILVAYTEDPGGASVSGRFVWRNPWNPAVLETALRRDPLEQKLYSYDSSYGREMIRGEWQIDPRYYEYSQRAVIRRLMRDIEDHMLANIRVSDEEHHWQPVFQEVESE